MVAFGYHFSYLLIHSGPKTLTLVGAAHHLHHALRHITFFDAERCKIVGSEHTGFHSIEELHISAIGLANASLGVFGLAQMHVKHHSRHLKRTHHAVRYIVGYHPFAAIITEYFGYIVAETQHNLVVIEHIMRVGVDDIRIIGGIGIITLHIFEVANLHFGVDKATIVVAALALEFLQTAKSVDALLKHTHSSLSVDAMLLRAEQVAKLAHIHAKSYLTE